jgi:hypothetical protein
MLPQSIKQALWSYDTDKIDVTVDKKLVISQVLNFGTKEATDWVFDYYGKSSVKEVALSMSAGQWNKKSLNFWSLILDFKSDQIKNRF